MAIDPPPTDAAEDRQMPAWWPFISGRPISWQLLRSVAVADFALLIVAIADSVVHWSWSHFADSQATWSIVGAAILMVLGGSFGVRNRFAAFAAGFLVMFAVLFAVTRIPDGSFPALVGPIGLSTGFAMVTIFVAVTRFRFA